MSEQTMEKWAANDTIFNGNLEYWMTNLPPFLKRLPIIHLAIPGSHNTMTYTIRRYNDVGPDEPVYLRLLGRFCSLISRPFIYNWSVTQHEDIKEQLNGGIRYLDLRLATKPNDEAIYFLHGLYGSEVTEPLEHVAQWLNQHPEEIVVMDCQHFYAFTVEHHRCLLEKIKRIFGNKMCPRVGYSLGQIDLRWLNERAHQVIIVYRNSEMAKEKRDIWPSESWSTPWPNTVDPRTLVDFLDARLASRMPNVGFVSQCLLTPDTRYVLRHLCGSLQRDLASLCRDASLPWIRRHEPGTAGLNVVITDYVAHERFLFSRTVIQRNNQLLRIPELAATLAPKYSSTIYPPE